MTDDNLDTKPLTTVIESAPDAPEGEAMPLTLDMLNTQIQILRIEMDALKQRFETLMTPQQITAMFERVETLTNSVLQRFSELEFSAAKVDAINATLQTLVRADSERKQSYEFIQRALSSLLGYDISSPAAPRIGLSIFEIVNQSNETSDSAAKQVDAVREEMAQFRYDSVQMLAISKQIADYHAKNEAALTAVAQNAQRWKGIQDAAKAVLSNPRILIPALGALGGSGAAVAKLIEALF